MKNRHSILITGFVLAIGACASPGPESSRWTATSWAAQTARDLNSGPYAFSAAPVRGNGLMLKLTIRSSTFGISSAGGAGAPDQAALEAAAAEAAPEGCTVAEIVRTEDGGATAKYECE